MNEYRKKAARVVSGASEANDNEPPDWDDVFPDDCESFQFALNQVLHEFPS